MPKHPRRRYWIGFDLGATKMMACVFDDDFKLHGSRRRKTRPSDGKEPPLRRIADTIEQALEAADVGLERVAGIGFGTPGPLDLDQGALLNAPNLPWGRLPLQRAMAKRFKRPVAVINDVDAGTYGEYVSGAARRARCAVGIFPGTGIGGGCVYEGCILRGRKLSCLEIGHIQVQPNGPLCGCGQRGCLEAVASRIAIAQAAAAAALRGEAPHLLQNAGADLAAIRSSALAEAIAAGDQVVENIVRDAARWLGIGIATVISLLAPDVVVLGGGLVEAMPNLFLTESESAARARVMPVFRRGFRLTTAQLGDQATALGAAAWARQVHAP